MRLADGGIDIFYIDESMDQEVFTMSAVTIPFLRKIEGTWTIVWEDQFASVKEWRRRLSHTWGIPVKKELKGNKLGTGRGRYNRNEHQFPRPLAVKIYRAVLAELRFLPEMSIITVVGSRHSNLFGHTKLEAILLALLQRMRTACAKRSRIGLVFFDEGHGEYRTIYRKARVYLPTGSAIGSWGSGLSSKNLPLNNFTKDANMKDSKHSWFIQIADLVSYAAFLKVKGEIESLRPWQSQLGLERLYSAIPSTVLNTSASRGDPQGIVRL